MFYGYILLLGWVKRPEAVVPAPETTVGLTYSPRHFYVDDAGNTAGPPLWLKETQEKLSRLQRQMARMQPGSRNYQKAAEKYRLLHEHIANQRRDFLHKESRRIANAWDAVCVRADDLAELSRELKQRGVRDAGFGMFREYLRYKLERQGKSFIPVDRYYPSTKICSACGQVQDAVSYRRRAWVCPQCGAAHLREVNAAKNIKAQGLVQYFSARERREAL